MTQNINNSNSNIYCVSGILQEKVMQGNFQSLTCKLWLRSLNISVILPEV